MLPASCCLFFLRHVSALTSACSLLHTLARCCAGYLDHPFRKIGTQETLMVDSWWSLRIDTLLLRSLDTIPNSV
jgi:hypothetical protein